MGIFSEIVESVSKLNEEIAGGKIYVYHMTKPESLRGGILKSGWERFYTGKNSNAYGPGIYTTLYPARDPRSRTSGNIDYRTEPPTLRKGKDSNKDYERSYVYGSAMLKCEARTLKGFVCFDMVASRFLYGRDGNKSFTDVKEQLKKLLDRDTYNEIKYTDEFKKVCFSKDRFTSAYVSSRALDRLCQYYPKVNNAINGFICHSGGDGFVIIFRNFNDVKPIAVSYNYGKTFKPIQVEDKYPEYRGENMDLRRELGLDAIHQYNNQTGDKITSLSQLPNGWEYYYDADRMRKLVNLEKPYDNIPAYFMKGFAKVKKDGKYNFFYIGDFKRGNKNVISPVWFDYAPETFTDNGIAKVVVDDTMFTLVHKVNGNEDEFVVCDNEGDYLCNLSDFDHVAKNDNSEETDYNDFL